VPLLTRLTQVALLLGLAYLVVVLRAALHIVTQAP